MSRDVATPSDSGELGVTRLRSASSPRWPHAPRPRRGLRQRDPAWGSRLVHQPSGAAARRTGMITSRDDSPRADGAMRSESAKPDSHPTRGERDQRRRSDRNPRLSTDPNEARAGSGSTPNAPAELPTRTSTTLAPQAAATPAVAPSGRPRLFPSLALDAVDRAVRRARECSPVDARRSSGTPPRSLDGRLSDPRVGAERRGSRASPG